MQIQLTPIKQEEHEVLSKMMLSYFKEIDSDKVVVEGGKESINYPYLESYWTETKRKPLFIRQGQSVVGFVLINDWIVHQAFTADRSIAEFYVAPPFRRNGLGKLAAQTIFNDYKGKWEIRQSKDNAPAVAFWRRTIHDFTSGDFKEIELTEAGETEIIQLFSS